VCVHIALELIRTVGQYLFMLSCFDMLLLQTYCLLLFVFGFRNETKQAFFNAHIFYAHIFFIPGSQHILTDGNN